MKNNIRYKGNINSTSVIIFLIRRQKLPAMLLCLGKPTLLEVFVMLVVVVHSFLCLHFVVVLHSFFVLHFVVFVLMWYCSSHCFSTSSLTLPWTIAGFLHPFYTFSPAHRRVIRDTFIFNHFVIFLPRALRFWVDIFYPPAFSTLRSFTDILPAFIKASLGAGSSSLKFAELHTNNLQNTDPAHQFVLFTVILIFQIQNDSVLNSTIY